MGVNPVQSIINEGSDFMGNMYSVRIKFPGASAKTLVTRATSFKPAQFNTKVYQKKRLGHQIDLPATEVEGQRMFTVTFCTDSAFNLIGSFRTWHSYTSNPAATAKKLGVSNFPAAQGEVWITALSPAGIYAEATDYIDDSDGGIKEGEGTQTWYYKNVWVGKVGQPEMGTDKSDSQTFEVEFHYGNESEPNYGDNDATSS